MSLSDGSIEASPIRFGGYDEYQSSIDDRNEEHTHDILVKLVNQVEQHRRKMRQARGFEGASLGVEVMHPLLTGFGST